MKQAWIREHRDSFPIALMCKVLKVSKSGYYASIDRPPSRRAERTAKIAEELAERGELETACRTTVASAMKRLGLVSKVKKRAIVAAIADADNPSEYLPKQSTTCIRNRNRRLLASSSLS